MGILIRDMMVEMGEMQTMGDGARMDRDRSGHEQTSVAQRRQLDPNRRRSSGEKRRKVWEEGTGGSVHRGCCARPASACKLEIVYYPLSGIEVTGSKPTARCCLAQRDIQGARCIGLA